MEFQQLLYDGIKQSQELITSNAFDPIKTNLVLAFGQRTLLEKITPIQVLENYTQLLKLSFVLHRVKFRINVL
ncbi:hypothetical protein H9X57_00765 [Flavobacterium piscinae]|uniref:hypothetical protein n=1 Tax=Flavobacterium piscinae TaxID=2506424 RepID=UPI0019A45182|nr:hypothetical protein [Flavobacterium piscinae]MBC8882473.1 hypothetical protein [Flavobacterium piscinae]